MSHTYEFEFDTSESGVARPFLSIEIGHTLGCDMKPVRALVSTGSTYCSIDPKLFGADGDYGMTRLRIRFPQDDLLLEPIEFQLGVDSIYFPYSVVLGRNLLTLGNLSIGGGSGFLKLIDV